MNVSDAIRQRRSVKKFDARPVERAVLEELLELAVLAPNHKLTQPWRFYVLGPQARSAYGRALGARKARKLDDLEAGRMVMEKVAREHEALPAMLVVALAHNDDPELAEEDYAAALMAVQNLSLAAVERGLGTHIKTGAIMADPGARAAAGVTTDERIVAVVNVGYPAEVPVPKARQAAAAFTRWLD